ncbi:MAG: hypothetical protein AAGF12_27050 [Myxococcota bacterium]
MRWCVTCVVVMGLLALRSEASAQAPEEAPSEAEPEGPEGSSDAPAEESEEGPAEESASEPEPGTESEPSEPEPEPEPSEPELSEPEPSEPEPSEPEPSEPSLSEPAPTEERATLRVEFRSEPNGVVLHQDTGEGVEEVCTAPCETQLEAGAYNFALAYDGSDPVAVSNEVALENDIGLLGTYEEPTSLRTAGWVVLISSLVVGAGLIVGGIIAGVSEEPGDNSDVPPTLGWFGALAAVAGTAVGAGFLSAPPDVSLTTR